MGKGPTLYDSRTSHNATATEVNTILSHQNHTIYREVYTRNQILDWEDQVFNNKNAPSHNAAGAPVNNQKAQDLSKLSNNGYMVFDAS